MIIVMTTTATPKELDRIIHTVQNAGLQVQINQGEQRIVLGILGDKSLLQQIPLEVFDGVERVVPISSSHKLSSREFHPSNTVIDVNGVKIGDGNLVVMAGPCAVESREQLLESAEIIKAQGAQFLRGGAFKPRTSPYSFQGLKEAGLKLLAEAREKTGLNIVTEVIDVESVQLVSEYADMLQIGARNMQNFQLLREVGKSGKPVVLKRGISSTLEEWLHAAEYIANEGNFNILFCERGIRTYETYTRNTLDLSAIPALKHLSHFPVMVDPSHGTGKWRMVKSMSLAAIAAGADALMIEVHPDPSVALSDGPQSLNPENYQDLMAEIRRLSGYIKEKDLEVSAV